MATRKGRLFIISAPSGCGKTTLCELLVKGIPRIARSVSLTTRAPRRGEEHDRDYIFVSRARFRQEIRDNNILEWAINFGHYYGTPKRRVSKLLKQGMDVILAIDVKGAMKVRRHCPGSVLIFVAPPSIKELRKRLKKRRTDDKREISKRINTAQRELEYLPKYDYVVINDNIRRAAERLKSIILTERCKTQ
ncbi:MAG: guanylate kinase [Candidatus Omnitrophica bacterium]|nr:guanylate kinase [Candidatus Omnitrophota bacterium]